MAAAFGVKAHREINWLGRETLWKLAETRKQRRQPANAGQSALRFVGLDIASGH